MTLPQVSTRAGSGTTLNSRVRKGAPAETSQPTISDHVGHISSIAEARKNRTPWKPEKEGGACALTMQKQICATYNITLTDFNRLVSMASREDGPCAVRTFLSKRLDNPEYTLQEYLSSRPSLRGL